MQALWLGLVYPPQAEGYIYISQSAEGLSMSLWSVYTDPASCAPCWRRQEAVHVGVLGGPRSTRYLCDCGASSEVRGGCLE